MKQPSRAMRLIYLAAAVALLLFACVGCSTTPVLTEVKVAVPVECREPVPARPAMPTERFAAEPTVDQYTVAAMAELEIREGYETLLRTALEACKAPIKP